MAKLTKRAELMVEVGELLYGDNWRGQLAESVGVSRQLMAFIATGAKPVSDDVYELFLVALERENEKLQAEAERLDALAKRAAKKILL